MNGYDYHPSIDIDKAMISLRDAKKTDVPLFDCTPAEAFSDLIAAKKKGCKFYTGCSNPESDGSCAGHPHKPKK